jgi:hypothetical protein
VRERCGEPGRVREAQRGQSFRSLLCACGIVVHAQDGHRARGQFHAALGEPLERAVPGPRRVPASEGFSVAHVEHAHVGVRFACGGEREEAAWAHRVTITRVRSSAPP